MMGENGPFTIGEDLQPKKNENSWTNNATVIWID